MATVLSFEEAEVRIARCIGFGSLTAHFGDQKTWDLVSAWLLIRFCDLEQISMSPLSFRFFICKIRRLDLMFSKASSISKILRSIIFREYWSYHHNSFYKKNCKSVYKTDDSSRNSKARYLQMLPLTVISLVTVC